MLVDPCHQLCPPVFRPIASLNPRYVAYAAAHGRTPEAMRAHDEQAWPGGRMAGFMLWISANWQRWKKANGRGSYDPLFPEDHESFDRTIGAKR